MTELAQAEQILVELLTNDRHNWARIYRLMQRVEDEHLYTSGGYRSFTAWVNALASRSNVHVSLLWRRKKAGKFYEEFRQRAIAKGYEVPELESAGVSSDDLSLAEKIAGGSEAVQDELVKKVLAKDMTRKDLKEAWALAKAEREKRGLKPAKTSRHDTDANSGQESFSAATAIATSAALTAYDIIRALSNDSHWAAVGPGPTLKHRVFPEFTVQTGSARHGRRIDALVAGVSSAENGICLTGVEIKVAKSDLLGDNKMAEYTDFVDYFYIAVPDTDEMVAAANSVRLSTWGIVAVESGHAGHVRVVETASKLDAVMREEALTKLCQILL